MQLFPILLKLCRMIFSSCTVGPTERVFLQNFQEIVEKSLPQEKVQSYYRNIRAAENFLLEQITFSEEMILVCVLFN